MNKILEILIKILNINGFSILFGKLLDVVKLFFQYKKENVQQKIETIKDQKEKDFQEKIDNVTENGNIEDLLDLKR